MKKLFLIISICLMAASCSQLRIVLNMKDDDGKRIYGTSNLRLFGHEGSDVYASMAAKVGPKDTLLAIVITCNKDSDHGILDKGDKMMFRLQDSSVIELSNLYDREYEVEVNTVESTETVRGWGYDYCYSPWTDNVFVAPYEVRALVPTTSVTQTTNSYALYLISKKDINAIIQKGVVKLRIQVEDKDWDMPNPEKATKVFTKLYTFLHETIKKGFTRTEF